MEASFPGLLHLQFLIACSMQQRRGEAWEILHAIRHNVVTMLSRLISAVKSCTGPILHSVLATKMGPAPTESYTECMKDTQARSHDSKGLLSDKCENAQL